MSVASVKDSHVTCDWFEGAAAKQKVFDEKQLVPIESEKIDFVETARRLAFILHEGLRNSGHDPSKMNLEQQCETLLENESGSALRPPLTPALSPRAGRGSKDKA